LWRWGRGCGGSSGGGGPGAGLKLVVEEGGFGFDALPQCGFGVEVGERRRAAAAVVLGNERGGGDEGGRDVEPFFHELVRGEEVDGEIGDEEDVPELHFETASS
jgi:hypothetical protein